MTKPNWVMALEDLSRSLQDLAAAMWADLRRYRIVPVLALALLLAPVAWAATAPDLVSPTTPPDRGYARFGDVIGPITADGTTTAVRATNIKPDHVVAIQIWGTWDGAQVTVQMRICATAPTGGSACPWVTMPNTVQPKTSDATGLTDNIQVYGPETEIRLSVASAGGSTSLEFTVRQ